MTAEGLIADASTADLAETALEVAAGETTDFGRFLRSAGKLAVARQVSSCCLIGVVFVLPALTTRHIATEFAWAYFAMLTLTSMLGLGLERLAGTAVAERRDATVARALAPVLFVRVVTAPLAALGMAVLFAFVGVRLDGATWVATLAWIAAAFVAPLVFGGLRAAGNSTIEPLAMVVIRPLQAGLLALLAVGGAGVAPLVAAVAVLEWVAVAAGLRAIGGLRTAGGAWRGWRSLPLRRAAALAGIDVVGILNLRADLFLAGHVLGAARGATYGLLYRAVDGFNGVLTSAGLWLYAESANGRDGGADPAGIRGRSLRLLPALGLAAATALVLIAGLVGEVVPRLASEADTLRILAIAFPLLCVNAVEVHVRTGQGRNRQILAISLALVAVNVPLCILALHAYGLPGAAAALAITELIQAGLLWCTATRPERRLIGPALATAVIGALALTVIGVACNAVGW